jgi:ABC-type transporter Mla subunit MlaD
MPLHDLTPELRTRLRRMEKVVGLFVLVAAVLLTSGFVYYVYHTAERKGWFTPKAPYFTYVQAADGLNVGDPVLLMGFSVGEITMITAQPPNSYYNVYVGFEVKKPYYGYIWTDSTAQVTAGSLLGGRRLEVTKGREGAATVYEKNGEVAELLVDGRKVLFEDHKQGVYLEPKEAPALAERAEKVVGQLEAALPGIIEKVDGVLANTERLTASLDELVAGTRPVVANLGTITGNLKNPKGSLGEWLIPPELNERVRTTLDEVDSNLTVLSGTLRNVEAITGGVRQQLDTNRDVLGEVSALVRDADDLVQGLKRHWLLRGAFPPPEPGAQELEPLPGLPGNLAP